MSLAHGRLHIWRALTLAAALGLVHADRAFAQAEPTATLAGGYAYLQQQTTGSFDTPPYSVGWAAAFAYRFGGSRLSAAGEWAVGLRVNDLDDRQSLSSWLGGVRIAIVRTTRLTLFAQGLAGLERFSEPGLAESGPAVQPGGGLDLYVSSSVFIRMQGDYRWSQANGATYHAYRVMGGMGVVLKK